MKVTEKAEEDLVTESLESKNVLVEPAPSIQAEITRKSENLLVDTKIKEEDVNSDKLLEVLTRSLQTPGQSQTDIVAQLLRADGVDALVADAHLAFEVDSQVPDCSAFQVEISWIKNEQLHVRLFYKSDETYEAEERLDQNERFGIYPGYAFTVDSVENCIAFYGISSRTGSVSLVELEDLRLEPFNFAQFQNNFIEIMEED